EAYKLIADCLRAEPDYLAAELFRATLLRRMKDEAGAEAILRKLSSDTNADPSIRVQAWAGIAQILDRSGDYETALNAMQNCKKILREAEGPVLKESEALQNHLRKLAEFLTPAHFQRWTEA